MGLVQLQFYNEKSILAEITAGALLEANAAIQGLLAFVHQRAGEHVCDAVPAYRSLLVECKSPELAMEVWKIAELYARQYSPVQQPAQGKAINIPVCFDPELGNDLEVMAAMHHILPDAIVELFLKVEYQVFMLGFLPGFAYMGEVDERIATPRKAKPVPTRSGAVGIAGRQTGIYPFDSPGGWHIVGYTPLKMFDASQQWPSLLKPGDRVRFERIGAKDYAGYLTQHCPT